MIGRHDDGSDDMMEPAMSHRRILGLVVARYLVLGMGAAVLLWKSTEVIWLERSLTLKASLEVALVSVLVPLLVWLASHEELRLRRDLEKRNRQLEQHARDVEERNRQLELRNRETSALNRLMQAHLAECLTKEHAGYGPLATLQPVAVLSGHRGGAANGHTAAGHHPAAGTNS